MRGGGRILAAVAALLTLFCASGGRAQTWPSAMTDADLGRVRGGYVSADGVTFAFAVALQTFVNGQLALASTLTVDNPGAAAYGTTGTASSSFAGAPPAVSLTLAGGATTLLQQFTPLGAQNVIATSASNRTVVQNVNVGLALSGFQENQAAYALHGVVTNLGAQVVNGYLAGR